MRLIVEVDGGNDTISFQLYTSHGIDPDGKGSVGR